MQNIDEIFSDKLKIILSRIPKELHCKVRPFVFALAKQILTASLERVKRNNFYYPGIPHRVSNTEDLEKFFTDHYKKINKLR